MVIDTDLEEILAKALEETRGPDGQVNLAEIQRWTGVSRKRLRRWKENGYHLRLLTSREAIIRKFASLLLLSANLRPDVRQFAHTCPVSDAICRGL